MPLCVLPPRLPFLAWGDFHARSRFACFTIPEGKWGTTRSLQKFQMQMKLDFEFLGIPTYNVLKHKEFLEIPRNS